MTDNHLYEKQLEVNDLAWCPTCARRVSHIRYFIEEAQEHYPYGPDVAISVKGPDRATDFTLIPCGHVVEHWGWASMEAEYETDEGYKYVQVRVWQFQR